MVFLTTKYTGVLCTGSLGYTIERSRDHFINHSITKHVDEGFFLRKEAFV